MNDEEGRQTVRRLYHQRCGYCTVHEFEAGTELEIDHFRPRSAAGGDDLDNLVYCCTTCNRLKGDFWPDTDSSPRRLLHPRRDDLSQHLRFTNDGLLEALTETGIFHCSRLRLNRSPLVALRRARRDMVVLERQLSAVQADQAELRARIVALGREIEVLLRRFASLLEGDE